MSNIFRGTTPTLRFKIKKSDEYDLHDIEECHITLENKPKDKKSSGRNTKIFDSPTYDYENNIISIELTQEDTLDFEEGDIEMQIKAKFNNGRVVATPIMVTTMKKILEEAIL